MTKRQTDAGAVVPSGHLLAHCIRIENIADITEAHLPSRWHPLRRAFMWGRTCCLREQAANIRDIVRERSANAEHEPPRERKP